ncbi:MAG: nucleoside 2-deoxyribosyltransferase [Candidatus Lokiarchaeota archaeon]|nr:nucleoside 2-deoxyribosyltransferase [Candidatus Lokiarchaeota archaeon]
MIMKRVVYLANGLGFSALASPAVAAVAARLEREGYEVYEPFTASKDLGAEIARLQATERDFDAMKKKVQAINEEIGRRNAEAISRSTHVVAIMDGGFDVDSGVAAEVGYAAGKGKQVLGLRTDFRTGGDNVGSVVNLQLEHFIASSGGSIIRDVEALIGSLNASRAAK